MAAEELLQCLRVDVKRRVQARVPIDRLDNGARHIGGFVPMRLEPLLELSYFTRALDLNIELDVLSEPRVREIAGADPSSRWETSRMVPSGTESLA